MSTDTSEDPTVTGPVHDEDSYVVQIDQPGVSDAPDDVVDETVDGTARSSSEQSDATAGEQEPILPWIYRRAGARSNRPVTWQLHYQRETSDRETKFQATVEDKLDENVPLADLREAAILVAMNHPDDVADQLREWGYDYE